MRPYFFVIVSNLTVTSSNDAIFQVARGQVVRQIRAEEDDMRVSKAVWSGERVERRRSPWPVSNDFLAVVTICLIFGLQILVVMQSAGGPEAYRLVASEGMQSQ